MRAWELAAAVNIGWIGLDAISSRIRNGSGLLLAVAASHQQQQQQQQSKVDWNLQGHNTVASEQSHCVRGKSLLHTPGRSLFWCLAVRPSVPCCFGAGRCSCYSSVSNNNSSSSRWADGLLLNVAQAEKVGEKDIFLGIQKGR